MVRWFTHVRAINIDFTNLKVGIRGKGARRYGRFPKPRRLSVHAERLTRTRSAGELAVFTNMAPERLCLGCGLRVEETFTPIYPGERGRLFAASVKLLQFALRAFSASATENELTKHFGRNSLNARWLFVVKLGIFKLMISGMLLCDIWTAPKIHLLGNSGNS